MKLLSIIRHGAIAAFVLLNSNVIPTAHAGIDPAASELLQQSSDKIAGAQTIRVEADQALDPLLGSGTALDRGPMQITVKRPNRFYVIQPADRETREIAYDGKELCVMHPGLNHHALEPLEADTLEEFCNRVEERFGFRPPVAELLAGNMAAELLSNVTDAQWAGEESISETLCSRLHMEQEGMTVDLWVGVDDRLPRRLLFTVTDIETNPAWNILFTAWELDGPVDETLFVRRPADDSHKVQMKRKGTP